MKNQRIRKSRLNRTPKVPNAAKSHAGSARRLNILEPSLKELMLAEDDDGRGYLSFMYLTQSIEYIKRLLSEFERSLSEFGENGLIRSIER